MFKFYRSVNQHFTNLTSKKFVPYPDMQKTFFLVRFVNG